MPNITPGEYTVLACCLILFLVAPGILSLLDDRRQRRAAMKLAYGFAGGADTASAFSSPDQFITLPTRTFSGTPVAGRAPAAVEDEPPSSPIVLETAAQPALSPVEEAMPDVEADSFVPPAPVPSFRQQSGQVPQSFRVDPVEPIPTSDPFIDAIPDRPQTEGRESFRLDEIRSARSLEQPPDAVRSDARRMAAWKRGEELIRKHQAALDAYRFHCVSVPTAISYAGAVISEDKVRLRFLLYPTLWPTSREQATDVAVLELDPSTGAVDGWVASL